MKKLLWHQGHHELRKCGNHTKNLVTSSKRHAPFSSTNGAERTGYPHEKEKCWTLSSQKLTQNGLKKNPKNKLTQAKTIQLIRKCNGKSSWPWI